MATTTLFTTEAPDYYDHVYYSLPLLAPLVYLAVFVLSFLILALYAIFKLRSDDFPINCSIGNWFGLIFDSGKIYLHAIIHTADTVSDLAVILQFYRLAYREHNEPGFNVEGLDMLGLFIGTVGCLLVYRLFTAYHFFYIAGGSVLLFLLQFADFGVYLSIYLAWKLNRTEPIFWQDYITHVEALFESIPQILIQSQFVLRTGQDINNTIVVASIVIAFVSVVTRFVKSDFPFINRDCHHILLTNPETDTLRAPYISWKWFAIYALRLCDILTRLVCGVFVWAVLGFIPLAVVLTVTMVISQRFLWKTRSQRFLFWFVAVPIECIVPGKRKHIYFRCLGNWTYLTIVTVYSYIDAWCLTCTSAENRNNQLNPDKIVWSLGYLYLFIGWLCSFLSPLLWFTVVPTLYIGKKPTPEARREEIMALPRMFYRKRGCYKATVTPLHFAVHRKFTEQIKDMLRRGEVDINTIRISGATALHSAVGRSLRDVVEILLQYGADASIPKKEMWYFRCCMPWKWCGRNWYEGKTALEIARYKVEQEMELNDGKELDDEHRYRQVLELLENPPPLVTDGDAVGGGGRTQIVAAETGTDGLKVDNEIEVALVVKSNTQVLGNSEEALMDDMVLDDADAEERDLQHDA